MANKPIVHVAVEPSIKKQLQAIAKESDMSLGAVIRSAIKLLIKERA
jgi:Ribbon-helix-helix protein, copG family